MTRRAFEKLTACNWIQHDQKLAFKSEQKLYIITPLLVNQQRQL